MGYQQENRFASGQTTTLIQKEILTGKLAASSTGGEAVQVSQMERVYGRLVNAKETLYQLVELLEGRLGPVMRPMAPRDGDKEAQEPRGPQSGLVASLHGLADEVDESCGRLGRILDRLEL